MAGRILVVTQHFWPETSASMTLWRGSCRTGWKWTCCAACPTTPKGNGLKGYSARGPWEEHFGTAQVFRAREWPRKGNTSVNIFLNYVSWPLYAAAALDRLPGGYDAVFCFNTSPVLMCWPAIRYAQKTPHPLYQLRAGPLAGKSVQRFAGKKTPCCASWPRGSVMPCTKRLTG